MVGPVTDWLRVLGEPNLAVLGRRGKHGARGSGSHGSRAGCGPGREWGKLSFSIGNGTGETPIIGRPDWLSGFCDDRDNGLGGDQRLHLAEEVGVVGGGIARTAEVREGNDSADSPEMGLAVRVARPSVERISAVGTRAEGVAAVAVAEVVSQAKSLIPWVHAGWAVTEGAEARGVVEEMNARVRQGTARDLWNNCGVVTVGRGQGTGYDAIPARATRVFRR